MKGRKMEPSPKRTKGSLSFSSGAMDSKSLAKNSSGSFAAVRGLRLRASSARAAASMARDGPASRVVYGGRSAADAGPRFWSGSCWKTWRLTSVRSDRAAGAKASTEACGGVCSRGRPATIASTPSKLGVARTPALHAVDETSPPRRWRVVARRAPRALSRRGMCSEAEQLWCRPHGESWLQRCVQRLLPPPAMRKHAWFGP